MFLEEVNENSDYMILIIHYVVVIFIYYDSISFLMAVIKHTQSSIENYLDVPQKVFSLSLEEVRVRYRIPASISEQNQRLEGIHGVNYFALSRQPFLMNLQELVAVIFNSYTPRNNYSLLENGPGPRHYAATNLLPVSRYIGKRPFAFHGTISDFTMLEISTTSAQKLNKSARYKGWSVIRGDIHTHNINQSYHVIFALSSLDSTAFPYYALKNIHDGLPNGGTAIIIQDVFPDTNAILGQEYYRRQNNGTKMNFGISQEGRVLLWVENSSGYKIPAPEYLRNNLAICASSVGFNVLQNGTFGSCLSYPLTNSTMKILRSGDNVVKRHFLTRTIFDESVQSGMYKSEYFADVLVLRK